MRTNVGICLCASKRVRARVNGKEKLAIRRQTTRPLAHTQIPSGNSMLHKMIMIEKEFRQ